MPCHRRIVIIHSGLLPSFSPISILPLPPLVLSGSAMPLPGELTLAMLAALALLLLQSVTNSGGMGATPSSSFREAPAFRNGDECRPPASPSSSIHIAMTLDDTTYLRGSIAGVHSILRHAACPENLVFHFLAAADPSHLHPTITSVFPSLTFRIHLFDPTLVAGDISPSLRPTLDQPLNYARIYLADILPASMHRIIYLDSDLIIVDDIAHLWSTPLGPSTVLAAPEYCHANFTSYFTPRFWSDPLLPALAFGTKPRPPCYFNTGVMVMDLDKWRSGRCRERLEWWMRVQKRRARIYELGSLPPFLLVFGGEVAKVEHRWNQHGLGGDNVEGLCRDLHPGKVSLLHWSGKGKPWLRLDQGRPCPLDRLWKPYDLYRRRSEVVAV